MAPVITRRSPPSRYPRCSSSPVCTATITSPAIRGTRSMPKMPFACSAKSPRLPSIWPIRRTGPSLPASRSTRTRVAWRPAVADTGQTSAAFPILAARHMVCASPTLEPDLPPTKPVLNQVTCWWSSMARGSRTCTTSPMRCGHTSLAIWWSSRSCGMESRSRRRCC